MPASNEYVWYKWWPVKALTSLRFKSLTLQQEGAYRRMYDLASIAQPSTRRGYFYEHDRPASLQQVFKALSINHTTGYAIIRQLASKGLMNQDENGAWGFPNFAKHQRGANLQVRKDGLGSAESAKQSRQNRDKIDAVDTDTDTDRDKEEDKEKNKRASSVKDNAPKPPPFEVPSDLQDLELYRLDERLCRRWAELLPAWKIAYPAVDVLGAVRQAHAWEVANKAKRKKDRPAYLGKWLAREQDKYHPPSGDGPGMAGDQRSVYPTMK